MVHSSLKLRQAIAYIQDRLEQDISLHAIATYLNMNQYHFCRWFKQSMGVPAMVIKRSRAPLRSHPTPPASLKPYAHSRRNRAVQTIVGTTIVIAGLCTYYSYEAIRSFTLENVKQNALLEVQQGVDDIDKWLAILRDRVETLAHTPIIQTLQWSTVEPYLQLELDRQRNFFKFSLIDAQGYRIGNTSIGLKRGNLNDRQYFQQAIAGQTYPSDAIISRTTGFVQINIATPIWSMPSQAESSSVPLSPENRANNRQLQSVSPNRRK